MKTKGKLQLKTLFLSDIHLGTPDAKVNQVTHLLRNTVAKKIVLNGDIIDTWSLQRGAKWTRADTYFIRLILKKMQKEETEIIYLRGNHDDILWRFLPFQFDNLLIENEYIHETNGKRYLVVHGDGFDSVSTNHAWIARIGSVGYELLLKFNRIHTRWRKLLNKPPYSLSKAIKAKVKSAVNFVGNYEEQLQQLAEQKGCDGIICGHIHTPADNQVGNIHYLNSGDWVESLTAVIENLDGSMEVITYQDFCNRTNREPRIGDYSDKNDKARLEARTKSATQ